MKLKAVILGLLTTTSAFGQQPTIDQRITELEKRVASIEAVLAAPQRPATGPTKAIATEEPSPLQLASWSYRVVRRDYGSDEYEITLDLKNSGIKDTLIYSKLFNWRIV